MTHAILVLTVVVLCLAVATGGVTYVNAPMFLKPRARRGSAGLPAIDPKVLAFMRAAPGSSKLRERRPAVTASPEGPAPAPASGAGPAPTRTDLPIPPPRNGVRLQDRPRQTVDVIICDPAVTPVVPRYYRAWLAGWWTP